MNNDIWCVNMEMNQEMLKVEVNYIKYENGETLWNHDNRNMKGQITRNSEFRKWTTGYNKWHRKHRESSEMNDRGNGWRSNWKRNEQNNDYNN